MASNSEARKRREAGVVVGNSLVDVHEDCRAEIERLLTERDRWKSLTDDHPCVDDRHANYDEMQGEIAALRSVVRRWEAQRELLPKRQQSMEPSVIDRAGWTDAEAEAIRRALEDR